MADPSAPPPGAGKPWYCRSADASANRNEPRYSEAYETAERFGFIIGMGRVDVRRAERYRFSHSTYFAGVELFVEIPRPDADLYPFSGVNDADLAELCRMLVEVGTAKSEYGLTRLDDSLMNTELEANARGLPLP